MQKQAGRRVWAPRIIALSTSFLLVSCGSERVYEGPEMRMPDRYSMIMPIRSPDTIDPNWWRAFDDPLLDRLIAEGLSGSVSLAEAKARLREAEALARRAGSAISGDGRIEGTRNSASGNDAGEVGLNAEFQPPGGLTARAGAARARLQAAGYNELDVRRVLLAEIAIAYVDLRFAQQQLVFQQQDRTSRRKTLEDVTAQVNSGAATEFDRMRAQSLVTETETQIPRLEANIVAQRNRISTLLGRPVGDLNVNLAFSGRQPRPSGQPAVGVPADLIRARPDIRQAERLYAAAVSDIGEAQAARYPRLSLSGLITTPLAGGNSAEVLGAGLIIPVFTQSALEAEVSAAEARADQAILQWRRAVLTAVEEVENALASLKASQRSAKAARELVALNDETLSLSRQLLESGGDITVLDVLERERAVSDARISLAFSLRDVGRDYVSLRTALGLEDGINEVLVVKK